VWPSQLEAPPTWESLHCLHWCHTSTVVALLQLIRVLRYMPKLKILCIFVLPSAVHIGELPTIDQPSQMGALRKLNINGPCFSLALLAQVHAPAVCQVWITRSEELPAGDAHLAHVTVCMNGFGNSLDGLLLSGLNLPGIVRNVTIAVDRLYLET
jgi:hypothetical protein